MEMARRKRSGSLGRNTRWKWNKRTVSRMDISPRSTLHRRPPCRRRCHPLLLLAVAVAVVAVVEKKTVRWIADRDHGCHFGSGCRTSTEWDDGEDDGLTCRHDRIHRDSTSCS